MKLRNISRPRLELDTSVDKAEFECGRVRTSCDCNLAKKQMKSQSETTNDEPIRNPVTTQTPFSFAHVN